MLSRGQLSGLGISERRVDGMTGDWLRMARGIYLVAPMGAPSWSARVWAGLLLGGNGARACLLTAATLDGLAAVGEDLKGRREDRPGTGADSRVQIFVQGRRIGPHEGFEFVRETPGVRLPSTLREPARTRIEDTTLDLAAVGSEADVVTWLTRACQRRLTTPQRLRCRASERVTLRQRRLVMRILDDVELGTTSQLEYRALHDVIRPHGLPSVQWQYRTGSGRRIADAAVVAYRVLIEFDGRLGHVAEGAFRDRNRDNDHTR